jgi:hypothetical protein
MLTTIDKSGYNMQKEWTELEFQNKCFNMPHWTTTARKIEERMVGDRNRPLDLILEWKMIRVWICINYFCTNF